MAGKRKKTTSRAKTYPGTKAEFIRSQPRNMSAQHIVDKAKGLGMTLTRGHVYAVKSAAKSKTQKRSTGTSARGRPRGRSSSVVNRGSAARSDSAAEAQLRKAIADIGLVRATEILDSVLHSIVGH